MAYRLGICLLILPIFLVACSSSHQQCRQWQAQGVMFSTLDSCTQCVETMGSARPEVIAGCAMGMDATKLISPPEKNMLPNERRERESLY